ncbi:GntR family transcriptional regulator [Gordonia neofelifaecis]|uniref:GntR family transcriptional regulator n=1 Tax=Gordonia neofelifaecis NRRL B-59395 TaxID=644548 RepID=F1YK76_9ACTN|nr:GntR family transcriptional regulator [Gordonia neofelifaecis]EGD54922.1 GntR family transcriptional regulator [Gordonia neofelifaecis NRRL B-59395]
MTVNARPQLSDDVATHVREMILSGQVKPGEFLRTEPIAAALGISNTPVREGLVRLSGEGFVEALPRRGFAVAAFRAQDIRDLFWVQAMLAGRLAARAAEQITAAQLDELEALNTARAAASVRGDEASEVKRGHEFHRAVNLAADSPRLTNLLGQLSRRLSSTFYNDVEGHDDETQTAHEAIVDALRDRDGASAARLMRAHIMGGVDELIAELADRGIFADPDPGGELPPRDSHDHRTTEDS